jgi:nickel/cobalt transporter (NicO) family protein
MVEVSVFEVNVPPCFRLYFFKDVGSETKPFHAGDLTISTQRPNGLEQSFSFRAAERYLEANEDLPEPHEFGLTLSIAHGDHEHTYALQFSESDHHHRHNEGFDVSDGDFQDAHERAHAADISK